MAREQGLLREDISVGEAPVEAFNPLDHPILFSTPRRLTPASGWREQIPLGMLLVDLARPSVLVELGTQGGDSYCAFCQAVQQLGLDTACYAIDTWKGDEHTGPYGPEVLSDLRAHHDPLYGSFSRLVQSSFDQALPHFEDGQVDFLHIDGCHTYDAVRSDFESWLPKLSSRGIVAVHDTNVREESFGVHRLWAELRERYPSFQVEHGNGLGVLCVGADTAGVEALARLPAPRAAELRRLLFALGWPLGKPLAAVDPRVEGLQRELRAVSEQLGATSAGLRSERDRAAQRELEDRIELAAEAARTNQYRDESWKWCVQAGVRGETVERIEETRSWRYTRPLRAPAELWARREGRGRIEFPPVDSPRASLIVPVHSGAELTTSCLRSIADRTAPAYEVVLADDRADRATRRVLRSVRGARLITNEENLGFTRTVNRAAATCETEYLVICNNDIEVHPGWLSAMIACADSDPEVAIVVPKFLQPDGLIAEAGGIVFSDGGARHFARGRDAMHPGANYRREVDYGSAAAMLVRAEFWREVGGFDERYSPGYFEDTDLCFTARARGRRVMYEPEAEVVHVEGASHGTDEQAGFKAFQAINSPKFAAKWESALEDQPARSHQERELRRASDRRKGPSVLLIDHRLPSPDLDSGSVRMVQIIEALLTLGCSVRFMPDNGFKWEPYCGHLQRMGVEVLYGSRDPREELSEIGSDLDLVVMSRPAPAARFLPLLRELAPNATVAYDTVDLHFVREGRRAEVEEGGTGRAMADTYRSLELAVVEASDITVCVSEAEGEVLRAEVPDVRVEVIANAHRVAGEVPGPDSRRDLLFVGGFIHTPNVDAAKYLAGEVMPLIWRDSPDTVLRIVGSHGAEIVGSLAGDGIVVDGWVEDIEAVMDRARLMIAPLRYGAGVKGKITHSLARGLPVVTTEVGAEGLLADPGRDLLVAEDAEGIAADAVRLLDDDELWRTLSDNGRALAASRFSTERVAETLRSMLPGDQGPPAR